MRHSIAYPIRVLVYGLNKEAGITKYLESPNEIFDKLKDETFLFFDTETTGLKSRKNQLTEIAAQVLKGPNFKVIDTFNKKISLTDETKDKIEKESNLPPDPKNWTIEKVLKHNRYYDNSEKSEPEDKVLEDFADFCAKHNSLIVAQNAKFDMNFVNTRGKRKLKNRGVYDTMLFAKYFFIPAIKALSEKGDVKEKVRKRLLTKNLSDIGRPSSSLGVLLRAFAEKAQGWHRAIDDVKSTVKAFQGIMKYFKEHPEVHEEGTFKKEKGKALKEQKKHNLSPGKKKFLKQKGQAPKGTHASIAYPIRVLVAGSELTLTKRGLPDKKDVFTYHSLADDLWREIIHKAMKHYDIHFDLENNEASKENPKVIRISRPSHDKIQHGRVAPRRMYSLLNVSCGMQGVTGNALICISSVSCRTTVFMA